MEAPTYTDTILLEANRKSSAEYLAGNNDSKSSWTNDMGNGIKLDIGDKISVHSAYISEIGNEDSTIEIKGQKASNNLGTEQKFTSTNVTLKKSEGGKSNGIIEAAKTTEGNYGWEYTVDNNVVNPIKDDEINLTHSYYKCAQGDNYMTLPRKWGADDRRGWYDNLNWSQYDSADKGQVVEVNPYRLGTDYSEILRFGQANGYGFSQESDARDTKTTISHDGRRYTLFVRKSFKNYVPDGVKTGTYLQGERDPALMDFIWYKKTVKYTVTQGFNSPANVASQITNIMTDTTKIENVSYGEEIVSDTSRDGQISQNNLNLQAQSNTYEIFPCATAWFLKNAGELWFNDTYTTDLAVPYNSGNDQIMALQTNVISITFDDGADPPVIKPENYFTDGRVRTGWTFIKGYNASTSATLPYLDFLAGYPICNIREYKVPGDGTTFALATTLLGFGKENPASASKTYSNASEQTLVLEFSNENLPMLYESCYSTVGYLRPEIQQFGRELMDSNKFDRKTIDGSYTCHVFTSPMSENADDKIKSTILTGIPWTDDNLLKLKKLFDSQELYPELFDYDGMSASQKALINVTETTKGNVSVNKMRFLHMNDNSQEANIISYNASFVNSGTSTTSPYITVTSVTGAKRGMRAYLSSLDTSTGRYLPADTFITSIDTGNKRLYISNEVSASNVPTNGTISFTSGGLGSDDYVNASDLTTNTHKAGAVFFDYNPALSEIGTGTGSTSPAYNTLAYGFGKKYKIGDIEYIGLSVREYQDGNLPAVWFSGGTHVFEGRCIGFDKHFNAFGTGAILLTNGHSSPWGGEYNASSIEGSQWSKLETSKFPETETMPDITTTGTMFKSWQRQPGAGGWFKSVSGAIQKYGPSPDDPTTEKLFNEIYCGANQPALQFDATSSRFSFVNLHTPELIGTNSDFINASDVSDSQTPCFKLNKRLDRLNYSPDFIPYNNVFKVATKANVSGVSPQMDAAITPYAIMDAQGGIYLEDYGCDEKNWDQSLWELMGFTYSQFHNKGSRLQRFTDTDLTTSTPTTNALIKTEDLHNLVRMGDSLLSKVNTLEVNYPLWKYSPDAFKNATEISSALTREHIAFPGFITFPPVEQQAVSTSIEADNLPRKMLSPIYLIKTDLLNPKYLGGREGTNVLPIIGVVDKSSGYGDFYTGARDSTIFTNTIPRTIQNLKTSIVDADGTSSRVDDSCCVIYKITKQIKSNADVLQNILNPPPKQ